LYFYIACACLAALFWLDFLFFGEPYMNPIAFHLQARAPFCFKTDGPHSTCPIHKLALCLASATNPVDRTALEAQINQHMATCDAAYTAAIEKKLVPAQKASEPANSTGVDAGRTSKAAAAARGRALTVKRERRKSVKAAGTQPGADL
jgi:hypothetical protein